MITLPARIRSSNLAYELLENDFSQRKRELINLRSELNSKRRTIVLVKSSVLLAYAHVEGAVKSALRVFLTRLNGHGLTWGAVKPRLAHLEIDHRLARQVNSQFRRSVVCDDDTTAFLRTLPNEPIKVDISELVDQIGVINANTLRKILSICGFNLSPYEENLGLLDERLVAWRHELAHGSLVPIELVTAETSVEIAIFLIDSMLADFGNLLVSQSYISNSEDNPR